MSRSSETSARPTPQARAPRSPISRRQVESVISRSVAGAGIVFAAQTLPAMLGQIDESAELWRWAVVVPLFASVLLAAAASIAKRWVRTSHMLVSTIYVVALLTWPVAVLDPANVQAGNHWLYYLLTVATATAAIGLPTRAATVYLFIVPIVYGIVRMTPAGGGVTAVQSALDAVYAIILGGAVMIIVTMLRQAAGSVDSAQATALGRYGHAVRQHATEVERVQVDAIVHDSVLTTFLSAARANAPEEKALAVTMAQNAIGHLRDAALVAPEDGSLVRVGAVAARIRDAVEEFGEDVVIAQEVLGNDSMPVAAGEAVIAATVQAVVNSLQHAGPSVTRSVSVARGPDGGIDVHVRDDGRGFEISAVPRERLGVRVSILERVSNAGGLAEVRSAPGAGTTVRIRWPRPEVAS